MEYKNRKKNNIGLGSVYYSKQKDRWICQTYETDLRTGDRKVVRKTFRTKEKAESMGLKYVLYERAEHMMTYKKEKEETK